MTAIAATQNGTWRRDLRANLGISLTEYYRNTHPETPLTETTIGKVATPDKYESLSSANLPAVEDIPISKELSKNHPLQKYIEEDGPLSLRQIKELYWHPAIDCSIRGYDSGCIPAAFSL